MLKNVTRKHVAAALVGIGLMGIAGGIELSGAPDAGAHQAFVKIGDSTCLASGPWQFTLSITSDVAGGVARIDNPVSPLQANVPYSTKFTVPADQATSTLKIRVTWPDGFQSPAADQPPMSYTATRPASGCTPSSTSTPPTTTCAGAIPPREDCGGVPASVPPNTIGTPTTITPVVESTPQITAAPPASAEVPSAPRASSPAPSGPASIVKAPVLPTTGSSSTGIVLAGVAALLVGGALLLAGRRGSAA